jgi:glycosyltransferase involved in cell wall biosynthesis
MKSLLIVATISGTISGFLLPFIDHFRSLGWRVDGMAQGISNCSQCQTSCDRVFEINWSRNPLAPKNLLIAVPKIREIVAQGEYDLVHVHTPVAAFVTRYALKDWREKKNLKVIYTAHGFHFHRGGKPITNSIFLTLERIAGKWTDYLITINKEDEAAAKQYQIVPSHRVYYTPGIGVDTSKYNPQQVSKENINKIRQELNLKSEDFLLLCVAEFTPNKRHQDILQALAKLNCPEVHIAFAGDGTIREEIEKLATDLGLSQQVHFLGFRPDVPTLICASVATLLTSQREGLPRSIMEALSLATPVIGTDIRGTRDLLEGDCGLLVQVGDIEGLAKAMSWMVDNPQEAKQMGERGREKMANYDTQHIIQLYASLYRQAMELDNNKN